MPIFFAVAAAAAAAMLPLIVRFFVLSVVIAAVVKLFRLQCPLLAFFYHGIFMACVVCVFLLTFFFFVSFSSQIISLFHVFTQFMRNAKLWLLVMCC